MVLRVGSCEPVQPAPAWTYRAKTPMNCEIMNNAIRNAVGRYPVPNRDQQRKRAHDATRDQQHANNQRKDNWIAIIALKASMARLMVIAMPTPSKPVHDESMGQRGKGFHGAKRQQHHKPELHAEILGFRRILLARHASPLRP